MNTEHHISHFVKYQRNKAGLTQEALAMKAGVGLRFIRELEQGKLSLRLDKINQVLALFGQVIGPPVPERTIDPYMVLAKYFNRSVSIFLNNKNILIGILVEPIHSGMGIVGWKFVSNLQAKEYQQTQSPDLLEEIRHSEIQNIEIN
jgi:y4mF family transcriptional regulator